mmetsp:Transcript_11966/g.35927  ORF Transcript_11966/g.35927 Transcript_11966/m.35927 type:complete len:556 (-) Transcript_11966:2647-4314(-)
MAGQPYGMQAMLKEGHEMHDEPVMKNIVAAKELSNICRSSMGPNGLNKMVINHLDKLFITSDASTILRELEVQHPAAKLIVYASQAQEQEIGDGSNFVISFAGELLANAEGLLRDGLHTSEVADGYTRSAAKALDIIDTLVIPGSDKLDVRDRAAVAKRIRGSVSAKQQGLEDVLCPLIAEACVGVCPKNPVSFNVDNVRVVKIPGGGVSDSAVVRGMVLKRDTEGAVKRVEHAKVAVFAQGIDTHSTETKGTVLIQSAKELTDYSRSEEDKLGQLIQSVADSGASVVVAGAAIGEMAMHFIEKAGLMAIRIPSKFDLRRFCRAVGATALSTLGAPRADELGYATLLEVREVGGANVTVLSQSDDAASTATADGVAAAGISGGAVATVVLRASTSNLLDDVERAVDDGVNAYKALCRDARAVSAGGALEMEVARQLREFGGKQSGLEQYAIAKFADSLEVVPRTIAENSGLNATDVVAALTAAHAAGHATFGLDVTTGEPRDLARDHITDLHSSKWWALRLASDAAVTVLKVDQIIMAKQAGGPKPRAPGPMDDD